MVDYILARRAMVDSQINSAGVIDPALLTAMGRLPRERFVPEARHGVAYIDDHHHLGAGRFLPAPATFARLVQLAGVTSKDSVLEIGAGTGYGTAVLAAVAADVLGVEADPGLAQTAAANLASLHIENATIIHGDADILGDRRFDIILVEGALDADPTDLLTRLKPGGRLVALVRRGLMGVATRYVAERGAFKKDTHFDATLPPLQASAPADEFIF